MIRNRVGLCVLAIAIGWPAGSREIVTARVWPLSAIAPADVAVRASIEPNALNRSVSFVIDSAGFYASSTAELEGERAARTKQVVFRRVPAGIYVVRVTLFGPTGELGYFERQVELT